MSEGVSVHRSLPASDPTSGRRLDVRHLLNARAPADVLARAARPCGTSPATSRGGCREPRRHLRRVAMRAPAVDRRSTDARSARSRGAPHAAARAPRAQPCDRRSRSCRPRRSDRAAAPPPMRRAAGCGRRARAGDRGRARGNEARACWRCAHDSRTTRPRLPRVSSSSVAWLKQSSRSSRRSRNAWIRSSGSRRAVATSAT